MGEPATTTQNLPDSHPVSSLASYTETFSSKPKAMALNDRLPFDVLVQIFEEFAEIEDPKSPLECILEVCRFWRDSALDHRSIWTTFRIHITNRSEAEYWKKSFPKRVDRFGSPDALLDISIELVNRPVEKLVRPCGTIHVGAGGSTYMEACHALTILKVVAGKHGTRAVRWRSLSLNILHLGRLGDQDLQVLDYFLEARTPNLESLKLYGVVTPFAYHKRVFPYGPRLRRAEFHSCEMSYYPDTSSLASLTWYSIQDTSYDPRRNSPAIHALSSAQKITYLEIGLDWTDWDTPLVLQRVKTLKMPATIYPDLVTMIQVPSLRHLAIGLDAAAEFAKLKDCKGIPLAQVETLGIFHVPQGAEPTTEEIGATSALIVGGLEPFFARMVNLRVLEWREDMVEQSLLLKTVVELFMGGSVGDEVVQRPGSITRGSKALPERSSRP